jgi:hypothetical protein
MRARCNNPNTRDYKNYGGRGIGYDPAWESYENFRRDMGLSPPGLSLERVNVNGNYCRNNCCWATALEQANNRRGGDNKLVEVEGVVYTKELKRWVAFGFDEECLYFGDSFQEAVGARKAYELEHKT